jgi:hypothetical protein
MTCHGTDLCSRFLQIKKCSATGRTGYVFGFEIRVLAACSMVKGYYSKLVIVIGNQVGSSTHA